MNIGQLNLDELDKPYAAVVQLRTQPAGVLHQVILRPDKVKQTMRTCSMGHAHKSAIIILGESLGDEVFGWQHPENIFIVAVLGAATPKGDTTLKSTQWEVAPLE